MSAVDSSGPTVMSSVSVSNQNGSLSRPNVAQNQPYSTVARCFTSDSRLVPEGVKGRRSASSPSPSSFHTTTSRCRSRAAYRLSFSLPVYGTVLITRRT